MMRDSPAWQSSNDQYLADAIGWIRLRLERLAADDQALREGAEAEQGAHVQTGTALHTKAAPATTAPATAAPVTAAPDQAAPAAPAFSTNSPSRWLLERLRGLTVAESSTRAGDATGVTTAPGGSPDASSRAASRGACQAPAWDATQPPALIELGRRLGLSAFEREVVLLALAAQLDAGVAALCARVQRTPARQLPTLALALALFDHPAWDAMAPGRPLRCWQLLATDHAGEPHSLAASGLRPDPRIVGYVKGHNYLDLRIATLVAPLGAALLAPLSAPGAGLPPLHARVAASIERALSAADGTELPVCQLSGGDGTSKRMVAQHVAQARQLTLYSLPVSALPDSLVQVDLLASLWRRESLLLPLALYVEGASGGAGCPAHAGAGQHAALRRFLQRCGGLVMVDGAEGWHDLGRLALPWELAPASPSYPATAAAQPPQSAPHAA